MDYKSVMKQDYDKKIRFNKKALFCYSKKKLKKEYKDQGISVIGEIAEKEKKDSSIINIQGNSEWYRVFEQGRKSRLLYRRAGYLCTDGGTYVAVLKSRLPALFLILFLAAAIAAAVWLLFRQPAAPSIDPPPVDPNVGVIEGDDSEKKDSESGGGAVTLTYSLDAKLSLSTGDIKIYFLNPNASNQDISLALYLLDGGGKIKIAESGLICPGYGLTDLKFIPDSAILSEGSYKGLFVVSFYDPETGKKAFVESNITDVTLEVSP